MTRNQSTSQQNSSSGDDSNRTVFISYHNESYDFACRLVNDLTTARYNCWIDDQNVKNDEEKWFASIAKGINNSDAVVPIVTLKALESRWVLNEIQWAIRKGKLIVPVLLEDVIDNDSFILLESYLRVHLFKQDYSKSFQNLLKLLPQPAESATDKSKTPTEIDFPPKFTGGRPSSSGQVVGQRRLELDYLDRLSVEELVRTEKYTPLSGTFQRDPRRNEIQPLFELIPISKKLREHQETRKFENAIEEILKVRRAVLLGEPGSGKTTTIWKLAADLVKTAFDDPGEPLPILIRLGKWTKPEQSLLSFIQSELGELGGSLDQLLTEQRAAFLLDGLNELPVAQRDEKYPQVKRLIERHPKSLAIVSCREHDYTIDLEFDKINILPFDPGRIREFTVNYLGDKRGEELFWRIAGGNDVRETWNAWQKAGATFEMFWTAEEIPRENPDVFRSTTFEQDRIWREKVRARGTMMELARNPYMLLMLTSVYDEQGDQLPENRGELFSLFVETLFNREKIPKSDRGELLDGLAKVAFEMQVRRDTGDEGNALTVLPLEDVKAILTDRLLYLAAGASILSSGDQVRFTHQLLQEYFTARYMDIEIKAERLKASDIWKPGRWWERTNWEEAAKLLAGLYSADCSSIVEWVAEANPEVAAQCAVQSGSVCPESTLDRLHPLWIPKLTDLENYPDPKERAAIGRALGLTGGDDRKGIGTLINQQGVALPDIDWVEIPGGEFQYGQIDESDNPQNTITVPSFQISRYPVTYAQFQTFMDDPEGFADQKWFEGMAARDEDRPLGEQAFKFANHPRERVNWYGAMAFCRWMSWRLGAGYDLKKVSDWAVRLPTEFEWEMAARGTDGRIYPYKGKFDAKKGNTNETDLSQTSAVGIFPNGASPYDVMDMSGNVWEWCLSDYNKPQLDPGKEKLGTNNTRVLRGGSWDDGRDDARAVYRYFYNPGFRFDFIGFRVVVRPPS